MTCPLSGPSQSRRFPSRVGPRHRTFDDPRVGLVPLGAPAWLRRCESWSEALKKELVRTVWAIRRWPQKGQGHRYVRGACLVRVEPSAEEVALRRKLVRELPDELEAAVAYLDELLEAAEVAAGVASFGGARPALLADLPASAVERLCRHLRGECFECGGPHLVARCPRLLPTAPPPTPKPLLEQKEMQIGMR